MPAPWSSKLIRDGLTYSVIMLAGVFIPLAFHPDRLSENPINWLKGALIALGIGFALSVLIWFFDRRLPQLTAGSAKRRQIAILANWLFAAATLFIAFSLMSK